MCILAFLMPFTMITPIFIAYIYYNCTNYIYIEIFALVEEKHYLCNKIKTFYNCSFPK